MWTAVMLLILVVATFYLGIIVGIMDCKRRFNIPSGAVTAHHIGEGIYAFLREDDLNGIDF